MSPIMATMTSKERFKVIVTTRLLKPVEKINVLGFNRSMERRPDSSSYR